MSKAVAMSRDTRRDDQGQAVEQQCRQLVTEILASAGGKDGKNRLSRQKPVDDRLLSFAEVPEAEDLLKDLVWILGHPRYSSFEKKHTYNGSVRFMPTLSTEIFQ